MVKSQKRNPTKHTKKPYKNPRKPASATPSKPSPQHTQPIIPFSPHNRILLLGEGDFSFSTSLLEHHACPSLLATSYDSQTATTEKYPQAAANVKALQGEEGCRVLYSIDATKLRRARREIRKGGFDRIVFNFPHVGGLTKDVNRQVRANQELLVGFFGEAIPLLAEGGQVVVTLFEGEPYQLWNIRDLGRHVGLRVERSFRFQATAYPGYRHARTLGNMKGGGGWKGEDRVARTYVFEVNNGQEAQVGKKKKRKREESDEESD